MFQSGCSLKICGRQRLSPELETGDSSWMNNSSDVITDSEDSLFVNLYAT